MHTYTFSLIHSTKTGHLLNARAMPRQCQGALGLEWACGFWKAYLEEEAFQLDLGGGSQAIPGNTVEQSEMGY